MNKIEQRYSHITSNINNYVFKSDCCILNLSFFFFDEHFEEKK